MHREPTHGFRLSPGQRRLWMLHGNRHSAYRAQCAVLITGSLDAPMLRAALRQVVARHEILRTTFRRLPQSPMPVQVVAEDSSSLKLALELPDLASSGQAGEIALRFQAALRVPFDLEHGPLLQAALVPVSPASSVLLLGLPALCADRLTLGNLVREICRAYAACVSGQELADQPLQYADLAEWQNELFEAEDIEIRSAYWHEQHFTPLLDLKLPCEIESVEKPSFEPRIHSSNLDAELWATIVALAQQLGTEPAVYLLACWSILLWRLTEQPNLVIGAGCDGRNYEELHEALGLFAKYLPIRLDLQPNTSFAALVAQVDQQMRQATKRQEFFSWDQEDALDESLRFFPSCFDFEQYPAACTAGDVSFAICRQYACIDRFKVKLVGIQQDHDFTTELHYDPACFPADAIERMLANYHVLLKSAADEPTQAIRDLAMLSAAERRQLHQWSMPPALVAPQPVHSLIADHARVRPDAIALVFEQTKDERRTTNDVETQYIASLPSSIVHRPSSIVQLTYRELNARANQLAHLLRALGVGPDVPVALALPPSLDRIVALLAVLAAGGAFVPLELTLPSARLDAILAASGAPLLLTHSALLDTLPNTLLPPLCLDELADQLAAQPTSAPPCAWTPEQLAYVIYTSGSTGAPKGVAVPQRGLANLVAAQADAFALTPDSRVLQFAPLSVDAAVAEVLVTLGSGATLVLPAPETRIVSTALLAELARQQITTVTLPPTVLGLLPTAALPGLATLVVAGEACGAELVARWGGGRRLVNAYGPTEATVCAALGAQAVGERVTIGRALAGSAVYVLDAQLRPAGIGVVGELYLGGDGLARGYLGRPDLTAERFVPNPFAEVSGIGYRVLGAEPSDTRYPTPDTRLYKTGDLARYRADGRLEYVGRRDGQVKVRGFRVELGEVEAALRAHPMVQAGVVLARTVGDELRLVAYVVQGSGIRNQGSEVETARRAVSTPDPRTLIPDLRAFLRERLPVYMLPSAIIPLKAMPRTPSGKIDRRALPDFRGLRIDSAEAYVAPQTELERAISALWQELLQIEKVGIYDNFFDLGGHSLLMVMAQSKLQEQFNRELSLTELFTYPTIHALSQYIAGTHSAQPGDAIVFAQRLEHAAARSESRAQQRQLRQTHSARQMVGGQDEPS